MAHDPRADDALEVQLRSRSQRPPSRLAARQLCSVPRLQRDSCDVPKAIPLNRSRDSFLTLRFRTDGTVAMHFGVLVTEHIERSGDILTGPPGVVGGSALVPNTRLRAMS